MLDAVFVKKESSLEPVLIALHTDDSFLVENPGTNSRTVMSYRWNGFGFTGIKELKIAHPAERLSIAKEFIQLIDSEGDILKRLPLAELISTEAE